MKKIVIMLFAIMALNGLNLQANSSAETENLIAQNVVSRKTSSLYWRNECLTLYSNGKCTLTGGDNTRIEGSYQIKDGWLILYLGGNAISCKATIRGGSVSSVSYNGNVYRSR